MFFGQEAAPALEEVNISCRDAVREAFRRKEVPEQSLDIMLASLSNSSTKQYASWLKKWAIFCENKNEDICFPNVPRVIEFLSEKFQKGAAVGTLNSCRSAIALLYGPELGEDPRVKRLFKGFSNIRPGKPKYDNTWDPQQVLGHLSEWGP